MKIVHINVDQGTGGGAANAIRLIMRQQNAEGHEIFCLCRDDVTPGYRLLHLLARIGMKILFGHCYSGGILPTGLAKKINALNPDLVYLHRLQLGTIGMKELLKISAPLIICFHDLWLVNGVCPYWKEELFELPMTSRMRWLDNWSRNRKQWVFKRLVADGRIKEVQVASEWVKKVVEISGMFAGVRMALNSLPVDAVYGAEPSVRDRNRDFVILFGAAGNVFSKVKGFDRLEQAIEMLPASIKGKARLKVFGATDGPHIAGGMPVEYLGDLSPCDLAKVYAASNVLALPSRQETYGLVKHEAFECGCPVVVFNETSCPEGIEHGSNGWVANNISEFAMGISKFFSRWQTRRVA